MKKKQKMINKLNKGGILSSLMSIRDDLEERDSEQFGHIIDDLELCICSLEDTRC